MAADLPAARALYDRVLAEEPTNATVIFRVGVLEMQAGRPAEAVAKIERALTLTPTELRFYFGLGQALMCLNRFDEAISAFRKVAAIEPGSADVHFALGLALQSTGDQAAAIASYRTALEIQPNFAGALTNLGAALRAVGRTDDAIAPLTAAVDLEPAVAGHHVNLGAALCQRRKFGEAAAVLRCALELNPNSPEAAFNLGNALQGVGKLSEAAAAYRNAIALKPRHAEAYNNLGAVCKELGDFKAAAAAFDAAMRAQPDFVAAYNNAGCLLRTLGRIDEAETVLRKALAVGLRSAAVFNNLGSVLKDGGALEEAIAFYRKAAELDPGDAGAHGNLIYSLSFCAMEGREVLEECRRWGARHGGVKKPSERSSVSVRRTARNSTAGGRLRIGYVSGDFRDHCQSLFTIPLLAHHDHEKFEIFCYSSVERPDEFTRRIAGYADVWRDARSLDDAELADLIRGDGIDVLVDLGMHMATGRPLVFARSPALVQVAWLAYPGTTGLSAMHYRLTDPRLDPPGFDDQYTERSIRLPDSFWCYDPLAEQLVTPLPANTNGFITFGCLNNPCKLTDRTLAMWGAVMAALPTARLLLMMPPGRPRERLTQRMEMQGITADRTSFVPFRPRAEYLRTYHQIDLGLDTFPYNGHTTSLDSLWMGVPVVTRVGATAVGRAGLSQLFNLNLSELAAGTDARFVEVAVELANDLPRLAELRRTLRQRMERSPLMDPERFARNIEAAYRQMCSERVQLIA